MKNKTIAYLLISLCLLSLLVGVFSASKSDSDTKEATEEKTTGLGSVFSNNNKIALVTLDGEISSQSDGYFSDMNSADGVRKALRRALEDNSVKGVLLKVNSPGGTVGLSQEVYNIMLKLRAKKPVVVSMTDLAASGGYYIASAADRIYANPGTLTGSIGVIMSTFNAQNLLNNKLGVQSVVIKSGKYKDIASPYKPMTSDERKLLQDIIDSTYQQFVSAIIQGRVNRKDNYSVKKTPLSVQTLRQKADGRVFTGQQAVQLGFVDALGGIYEAQEAVNKMAKEKFGLHSSLPLVPYNMPSGLGELLFGATDSIFPNKGISAELKKEILPMSQKFPHQPLFVWE